MKIVYFFDYTVGCGWWMMVLYVLMMFAVFVIRGKPYSGEKVAGVLLKPKSWLSSVTSSALAFSWNVVRPLLVAVRTTD